MIFRDKHLKVHRNHIEQVGGNMELLIGGIDGDGNQDIVIKGDKKEHVEKDDHFHVTGVQNQKIDKDQSLTVGGGQQEKIEQIRKQFIGKDDHLHVVASRNQKIDGSQSLTVGGTSRRKSAANTRWRRVEEIHLKAA